MGIFAELEPSTQVLHERALHDLCRLKSFPIGTVVPLFSGHFFSEGINNETVNPLPNIRDESDGFRVPLFVCVLQVVRVDLFVQNHNGLRQEIFTEAAEMDGKYFLVNAKDHESNMPEH